MRQLDKWIDSFQQSLSVPIAGRVADFARVELINVKQMLMAGELANHLLMVVLGPFAIESDMSHSWWHGFKVFVRNSEVASTICRLDSQGRGGIYTIKLWCMDHQRYLYYGDPSQQQWFKASYVPWIINNHLAIQYHVGFVEDEGLGVQQDVHIQTAVSTKSNPASHITEREIRLFTSGH